MAKPLGVARSTLQGWNARAAASDCPPALARFLESPEGVQWLHRQVITAHFAITLLGGAGVCVVCQFLELSGLAAFVAASYGTRQGIHAALEETLGRYAREQRATHARRRHAVSRDHGVRGRDLSSSPPCTMTSSADPTEPRPPNASSADLPIRCSGACSNSCPLRHDPPASGQGRRNPHTSCRSPHNGWLER
jgi:hypothetical protein